MGKHNITIFSLLFFTLLLHISSAYAARLLITSKYSLPTATEPSVNLALPAGNDVVNQEEEASGGRILPCNTAIDTNRRAGMEFQTLRLCAKPGKFLLTMLPKGVMVPPSGPSKRTNDNNN